LPSSTDPVSTGATTAIDTGSHIIPTRYITQEIPGIGGRIKQRPEDFLVDEQPQYQPIGSGEHIYLLVQKKGLSTYEMIDIIARHFGAPRDAIGFAGLKDKHAITRQVISIHFPGKSHTDFPMLEHERIAVLWADQHTNKLRRGHLKGNRFSIRIRGVEATSVLAASKVLNILAKVGVPNRVGEQRFGMLQNNHLIGRDLIIGDFKGACDLLLGASPLVPGFNAQARALYAAGDFIAARDAYPPAARAEQRVLFGLSQGKNHKNAMLLLDRRTLSFFVSAFQSAVFNATLDERIERGAFDKVLVGDIVMKLDNRATFEATEAVVADPTTTERLAAFEISPSGPYWGPEMRESSGVVAELEHRVLGRFGVKPEQFASAHRDVRGAMAGERRPLRIPLIDPTIEGGQDEHGPYVRCAFELPRGSFATVVMREVMKPVADGVGADVESELEAE